MRDDIHGLGVRLARLVIVSSLLWVAAFGCIGIVDPSGPNPEPMCGNDTLDPGESCDGNCPTDCNDNEVCTIDTLVGAAEDCTATCVIEPVTSCVGGDGCCPAACTAAEDGDCQADPDRTPPAIEITSPANNQTMTTVTIIVSGTASDDVALSKVEVKVGAGSYVQASGTTSWNKSVTLTIGANTIVAKATDSAGNNSETSVTVTHDPTVVTKPEIGNWDLSWFSSAIRAAQNRSEITWDVIIKTSALQYHRPGVTTVYYDAVLPLGDFRIADLDYVKSRFEKATADKDKGWQYGVFLLNEEAMTPLKRVEWGIGKIGDWTIDGSVTLAGVQIEALKPWYIDTYGTWDQGWWDSASASNNLNDPKIKAWNTEYSYHLYKAWHQHMHDLGKKSAIVGLVGIRGTDFASYFAYYYPGASLRTYILDNYDFILQYGYPTKIGCDTWDCVENSGKVTKAIKEAGYKGKLGWLLTAEWSDGTGVPWRETVAEAEFNAVAPWVDIVFARGHADGYLTLDIMYPPYFIDFWNRYGEQ